MTNEFSVDEDKTLKELVDRMQQDVESPGPEDLSKAVILLDKKLRNLAEQLEDQTTLQMLSI